MGALSLPRKVSVLGSTGSIGVSTLDLFAQARVEVEVVALAAGRNVERLAAQALEWRPQIAVIEDEAALPRLRELLAGSGIRAAGGSAAVAEAASAEAQWVMSAIVGFAGLAPTLAAARAGAVVALANKESLICAGPDLLRTAKLAGGAVIPVDSEHSAIFQVFSPSNAQHVSRLILTASGGPFRGWSRDQMARATPEQALAHPNWSMGAKISVDSATMMNKGLEVIEAAYLFAMPAERIEVLIHAQSIVHSLVEYADGSTLAQLGPPDMRAPIACAFAWPDRLPWPAKKLDLARTGPLTFEDPDLERFPALRIAKSALAAGGVAPTAMNAADEVAVAAFLGRRIGFLDIAATVEETLTRMDRQNLLWRTENDPVEGARLTDATARRVADEVVSGLMAPA
ncbi:1-deoxy-D-xylulose-5-phosphate reductoisomerase [Phenylobacterium sp.]|jgi:1-deoxy-D-xylulose-5-phosphate reductoisomerase|uniref:1-deoxy-D-xylulose-5-phosphate reductoisomerase n=1 Tax=Phenylobacterium sp. TaxID=1871053 RepID=UPI002E364CCD|nr:1-deoxy-D-xylulose-5-phosphate reductoisomerase [Phenylobacterium sp.]HEX4711276.1 1-deoxy-D-xylulose-5-phosphate reductoisomerase [Phenylobacterium sp.]